MKKTIILLLTLVSSLTVMTARGVKVSEVDTSLKGSEKYTLRVDGKPYYMTNIQIRFDKLHGYLGWNDQALEAVIKRAADDGFNTVSIPVFWREVEPEKDKFSWTILDKYLGWCKKYNLKMELLWFSWSSGGRIQWLTKGPKDMKPELRTPDYVCTPQGTSEYKVLRKTDPWTLDWNDKNLLARDKYVLSKVMAHVAEWDKANGNPHTVIGVQLGNEALGHEQKVDPSVVVDYYSQVGESVKKSDYVVWTRMNCVIWMTKGRIEANEKKRVNGGTNIDFVGVDVYGTNAQKIYGDIDGHLPVMGKNFQMIMEIDAKDSRTPIYQMAALAGGKSFDYYNMAAVDGNDLYTANGTQLVERPQIKDVRRRNKILNLANQDIATKAQGKSLYVYNWAGSAVVKSETGLNGIVFHPVTSRSQAIALRHSPKEIVLLSTDKSRFTLPASLKVKSLSLGRFDAHNQWKVEGKAQIEKGNTLTVPEASAIRLVLK